MNIAYGTLVLLHSQIYLLYFVPPPDEKWPFTFNKGWFYDKYNHQASIIGKVLAIAGITALVLGSFVLIIEPSNRQLWGSMFVIGALLTSLLQGLFYNKQLIFGLIINAAIIWGVLIANWSFGAQV